MGKALNFNRLSEVYLFEVTWSLDCCPSPPVGFLCHKIRRECMDMQGIGVQWNNSLISWYAGNGNTVFSCSLFVCTFKTHITLFRGADLSVGQTRYWDNVI